MCRRFCIDSASFPGMCYLIDFIDTAYTACNFMKKMTLLSSFLKEEIDLITSKIPNIIFRILIFHGIFSAVPRHIFILLNWCGRPKNEVKFLNFNRFNNCPFFLPNYFINLLSCLASKSS